MPFILTSILLVVFWTTVIILEKEDFSPGLKGVKPRHICAVKLEVLKSWTLEIDYSRALCLCADQKTPELWE